MSRLTAPLLLLVPILLAMDDAPAEPPVPAVGPAITELEVSVQKAAFDDSAATRPLVLDSLKAAGPYFDDAALEAIDAAVDFDRQVLLVFAWRGSGQDRLSYSVAESMPEQVTFTYRPGRTRDLRSHTAVYVLRSNVTWKVVTAEPRV